jgi:DNA-directed RNA polymerase subunit H (RpoH/RPB5)
MKPDIFVVAHHKILSEYIDGKVLDELGFKSKVLPGFLTDLSAWVGFCTSSPE